MEIRKADINDAKDIANIHSTSWRATYARVLSAGYLEDTVPEERIQVWNDRLASEPDNQLVVVAEVDDEIIGFACAYYDQDPQWGNYLDNLHVVKAHQSQGVGRRLLGTIASWCHGRKPNSGLFLRVNYDNTNAQKFYKNLGARNTDSSDWHAPDGSIVPTYWFVWNSVRELAARANR